jgi:hypothetical protein
MTLHICAVCFNAPCEPGRKVCPYCGPAAERPLSFSAPALVCGHTTKLGDRCQRPVDAPGDRCVQHQGDHRTRRPAAHGAGALTATAYAPERTSTT